jgi:hypothetical protein
MIQQITRVSSGPKHHFFGYYGINPWDRTGQLHLALETDFHEHRPIVGDTATVGTVDRRTGEFSAVGTTEAFNLQQGAMMHWIGDGSDEELTYNAWVDGRVGARAYSPATGATRTIDAAIAAVSPDRRTAMGLDFARMAHCRPVVGYANDIDPAQIDHFPEDDGLYLIDLESGRSRLAISIADVVRASEYETQKGGIAWFNHIAFNTVGSRLLFFLRIKLPGPQNHLTSVWSVDPDGGDLRCQIGFEFSSSHFAWSDPKRVTMSTELLGEMNFVEIVEGEPGGRPVGAGVLPSDGHNSFSPDKRWMLCDTYPLGPDRLQQLFLFHVESGVRTELGAFHAADRFTGDIRCDLHPRWSPDGKTISIDSVHEGSRQIYNLDVSELVLAG